MSVVCEGIGTEADRSAAVQAGCDMLQGYFLGKPQEIGTLRRRPWMLKAA